MSHFEIHVFVLCHLKYARVQILLLNNEFLLVYEMKSTRLRSYFIDYY